MGPRTAVALSKEVKTAAGGGCGGQGGARLRSCSDGSRYSRRGVSLPNNSSSSPVLYSPKSVLKRPVSTEELQRPGGPYIKKTFTIVGDAVGWGFVVRGNRPCHIQAVEPCGPAAAAGMKVQNVRASWPLAVIFTMCSSATFWPRRKTFVSLWFQSMGSMFSIWTTGLSAT
ncbi:DEP domain-containing mTOR-interacting protein-like isoform X1 [Cottoperca gobio]|uniref:DEP domain-containing mTOR-interacting protein-like isoform X1 n=1 Tax=Cottoperca gobio TaxID=56716 RepID=A0A6J2QQT7_COTGO|nr:DEP domain-containing mTOR-interacting protein-like isoform X1 [Cottoperca gobio]